MSIPEFVLRKLVLPGSLKRTPSGFKFIIHNTFAPATITRFSLTIDGTDIDPSQIAMCEAGGSDKKASECTPENPLLIPVNIDIIISANSMTPLGRVGVKAVTKEVGPIEFMIESGKKKKKSKSLPSTFLSYLRAKSVAEVKIDTLKVIGQASPFLLGQFVEHLERCVYDGIWTADGKDIREDSVDLIKQLNPPMIRYPGGNFASGYHWEDGIGPKINRPDRHDAAWQAEESNQVGTDEFLTFCEEIGTEPCLVVNDGSGTPEEAARWVAYCNSPSNTEEGLQRSANGHLEPYNVKYWGIGNEVWGAWQIGTTSAAEYVKRLKRFISAMKAVDPSIKIIAVGNHPLTDFPDDPAAQWNNEVLEKAGNQIDYLSWHIYQPEKEGWQEDADDLEVFKSICAAPLDIQIYIKRIHNQIASAGLQHRVTQALDEWNVWLPPKHGETSMHHVTYTMRDALYVASTLATLYRNCDSVTIANLAQLVNVLPLIQTNGETAIATTIYYPFILFAQMLNHVVYSQASSKTYNNLSMGPNINAHSDVPYLDSIVTVDEKGEKLTAILINRDPFRRMQVSVEFNPGSSFHPKSTLCIKSDHPLAANSFKAPHRVKITSGKPPASKGEVWEITMEPASIYFVEFE
jgi:alpha-N-arabinofuranosidase